VYSSSSHSSSSTSGIPDYIAAACFPGCVQLLANIFTLTLPDARGDNDSSSRVCEIACSTAVGARSAADSSSSSSSSVAAAVLSNVCGALLSLGQGVPDVDVTVGAAAASTKGATAAAAAAAAAPECYAKPTAASPVSSSRSSSSAMQLKLQCCEPACLVAREQKQQLTLQLQPPLAHGEEEEQQQQQQLVVRCRLVAFQDGSLLLDEHVTLQGNCMR
jgi:hypothetical protein